LDELQLRVVRTMRRTAQDARQRIASTAGRLESLSPLAVLARGYSLTQRATDGSLITDVDNVDVGDRIKTRYAAGSTISRIESIEE
jgi:exodeoxyribonuclease VII large subunit